MSSCYGRCLSWEAQFALVPLAAVAGSLAGGLLPGLASALLGTSVDDPAAYRYSLMLAGLVMVPAVASMAATRPAHARRGSTYLPASAEGQDDRVGPGRAAPYALILLLSLVVMFRFGSWGTLTTFLNVYMDDGLAAPAALIGLVVAGGRLVAVPAALAAPLADRRWGEDRTIGLGTLGMGLALVPLALIPQLGVVGLGSVGTAIAYFATTGPIQIYSQEIVPPAWRGTMAGALGLGAGLSLFAISLLGGFAITTLGYASVFLAGSAMAVAGALLFWSYFRVPRGELALAPPGSECG